MEKIYKNFIEWLARFKEYGDENGCFGEGDDPFVDWELWFPDYINGKSPEGAWDLE